MTATSPALGSYRQQFDRTHGNGAVGDLRQRAFDRFASLGFPTGSEEGWRFTDVTPIAQTQFAEAQAVDPSPVAALAKGPLSACQMTFVNGRFEKSLSSDRHELLKRLGAGDCVGRVLRERNAFTELNTALFGDAALLRIKATITEPIHLLFLSVGDGFISCPRVFIEVAPGAHATVVESHLGPSGGAYFTNAVTEIEIGDGGHLDHTKVQRESPKAFHVATIAARQGRDSVFSSHSISLGAAIARNDILATLDGEGADCTLNGLYEAGGNQLVDHHTTIDHAKPHGTSRELYKGILTARARGVFDGRIVVRPGAQKTNAMQTNKNLLLSQEALVNTKPQLEIFANDVKCKHGATIGQLDRDVLFYLRSRGIGHDDARRLLIHAFAGEIIDHVKVDSVRQQLGGCLFMFAQ